MKKGVVALLTGIVLLSLPVNVNAKELVKGRATVYSLEGTTKLGTQTRYGVCATGKKELLGKQIIIYQRMADDSIGDVIGIYSCEDTGCKKGVIDIWCPNETYRNFIINKTYENNCDGRIWIQIVEE